MKHFRVITVILVLVAAGVAFAAQVKDDAKKPPAQAVKKSECCMKMKSKTEGKMSCCSSDSAAAKDGKSCSGKH